MQGMLFIPLNTATFFKYSFELLIIFDLLEETMGTAKWMDEETYKVLNLLALLLIQVLIEQKVSCI